MSFKIGRNKIVNNDYNYFPKDRKEFMEIIIKLIKERGVNADLNDIDTSNITDMHHLFNNLCPKIENIKIDKWNMSNVTDISCMFEDCIWFNADLSNWDVSNIRNMSCAFKNCKFFTGKGLRYWKPKKVEEIYATFANCYNFKENLENWNLDSDNLTQHWYTFKGTPIEQDNQLPSWYKKINWYK